MSSKHVCVSLEFRNDKKVEDENVLNRRSHGTRKKTESEWRCRQQCSPYKMMISHRLGHWEIQRRLSRLKLRGYFKKVVVSICIICQQVEYDGTEN